MAPPPDPHELARRARGLPAAAREEFLSVACGGDVELAAAVRARLAEPTPEPDPEPGPEPDPEPVPGRAPHTPERIGRYRVLARLGEGGFGVVYRAEQDHPRRSVALKVLNSTLAGTELRRRFEYEVEILGLLQHPGIAQIYDAGTFADRGGEQPFFAMELVEGRPLTAFAREAGLGRADRLELVARVCDAVQHAHQRGVVHRDLKPANILVTADGRPKVLDFGIARALELDDDAGLARTQSGAVIGTLPYMSPEQAGGRSRHVDTRADVYSLGAILYELVTGRLPLELPRDDVLEALRRIGEERPLPAGRLDGDLAGDVETILGKALEKDPERRYASAAELAEDLRRHLRREPILARPPTTAYVLARFARRHALPLAGLGLVFAILVAATVVSTRYALRAERDRAAAVEAGRAADTARAEAESALADLEQVAAFQAARLGDIDLEAMGIGLREDLLDAARAGWRRARLDEREVEANAERLARMVDGANFTTVAGATLRRNLFDRTHAAVEANFADQPLVRARLHQSLANTLRDVGLAEAAAESQRLALELRREHLGPDDEEWIVSHYYAGVQTDSTELFRTALEASRARFGERSVQVGTSLIALAESLQGRADLDGAEQGLREALGIAERLGAEGAQLGLRASLSLASLLDDRGRDAEAEALYLAALGRLGAPGDAADRLAVQTNLAALLEEAGEYDRALGFARDALEGRRRLFGEQHPETIAALASVAGVLRNMGRVEEAEPHAREAFALCTASLGAGDGAALVARTNLATVLEGLRRFEELEAFCAASVEVLRGVLAPDDPRSAELELLRARALYRLDRDAEAEPIARALHSRLAASLGEEHPLTLRARLQHGYVLKSLGRLAEAEGALGPALDSLRRSDPQDDEELAHCLEHLAFVVSEQGRAAEARAYAEELVPLLLRTRGEADEWALMARASLGFLRDRTGDYDGANALFEANLRARREHFGPRHPGTLEALALVAEVRSFDGRTEEALELFEEAFAGWDAIGAEPDVERLRALITYGQLLVEREDWAAIDARADGLLTLSESLVSRGAAERVFAVHVVGSAWTALGRHAAAEPLVLEALAGLERLVGPDDAAYRRSEADLIAIRGPGG